MSAQIDPLKEKFQQGIAKAKQDMEVDRAWLDDTMEISNDALAEFIAKVTDRQGEIIAGIEEFKEEHNFNLPLADFEIV